MAERIVANSSPLVFFSRGGHSEILRSVAGQVVVPQAVADEVLRRGASDPTARLVKTASWLEIAAVGQVPSRIAEWGLGRGESEVLALALAHGCDAILDDLAARRCAASLQVPVRGTLGIVHSAKKQGLIPSARSVMEDLVSGGLYLSRKILDAALERVGE